MQERERKYDQDKMCHAYYTLLPKNVKRCFRKVCTLIQVCFSPLFPKMFLIDFHLIWIPYKFTLRISSNKISFGFIFTLDFLYSVDEDRLMMYLLLVHDEIPCAQEVLRFPQRNTNGESCIRTEIYHIAPMTSQNSKLMQRHESF